MWNIFKKNKKTEDTLEKRNVVPENIEETKEKEYLMPPIDLLNLDENNIIKDNFDILFNSKEILIPIGMNRGKFIVEELKNMPNFLIGGTVMSGKTTYVNTIIASLLLTKNPEKLKFIIYDAKKIDYSIYNGLPNLLYPVISDSNKIYSILKKVESLMNERYELLRKFENKNVDEYNRNIDLKIKESSDYQSKKIPTILFIIDDYSSLNNDEKMNEIVEKITTNGWKTNIFMLITANHPSSKIISTISKANFPARMSFRVVNAKSSQMIIEEAGAEKIKGYGKALYVSKNINSLIEIEVPTISDDEIKNIVNYIKENNDTNNDSFDNIYGSNPSDDVLYDEVLNYAICMGQISASLIQRKYSIGYNRAQRIMDLFEERGIVGPAKGSKPRDVLVKNQ